MARIQPIDMDQAQGKAAELLDELVERGGEPGPMVGLQLLTGAFNLIAGIHAPAEALAELTPRSSDA